MKNYLFRFKLGDGPEISGKVKASDREEARDLAAKALMSPLKDLGLTMTLRDIKRETRAIEEGRPTWYHNETPKDFSFLTIEEEQWLTGFWGGDGSMGVNQARTTLYIMFSQKDRQILDSISSLLQLGRKPFRNKDEWSLEFGAKSISVPVLEILCRNLVCPKRIEQVKNFPLEFTKEIPIKECKPTYPWLVGFWDAEGSVNFNGNHISFEVGQMDSRVLDKIKDFIGGSGDLNFKDHSYCWTGERARKFVPKVLELSRNEKKKNNLLAKLEVLKQEGFEK